MNWSRNSSRFKSKSSSSSSMVAQRHSKRPGRRAQSRRVLSNHPKNKGNSMVSSWRCFTLSGLLCLRNLFLFFPARSSLTFTLTTLCSFRILPCYKKMWCPEEYNSHFSTCIRRTSAKNKRSKINRGQHRIHRIRRIRHIRHIRCSRYIRRNRLLWICRHLNKTGDRNNSNKTICNRRQRNSVAVVPV